MLIGEMAVGTQLGGRGGESALFSHLSANPDAAAAPSGGGDPCPECLDSYGVAAQLRADRENRMSSEFRELGAVDVDLPAPAAADDGYQYGGRFADPAPGEAATGAQGAAARPAITTAESPVTAEAPVGAMIY